MRLKTIADARKFLGPRAAAQIEAQLTREVVNHIAESTKMVEGKARKFRNQPCVGEDGFKYDSKKEMRDYELLCQTLGRDNVIRQVSLVIGEQRIVPDFMVIEERYPDGSFRARLKDSKGFITDKWKAKANCLKALHGLEIEVI